MAHHMHTNVHTLLWHIRINDPICKKEGRKMKFIIVIVTAAAASVAATIIAKSLGIESSNIIGGAVGGTVGGIVGVKLFSNKQK
jgi:hypothetical protein